MCNPLVPNPIMRGALKGSLPLSWVEEDPKLHKLGRVRVPHRDPTKTLVAPFSFFSFFLLFKFFFKFLKNKKMENSFFFG
jgi:hypothetical protein